MIGSYIQCTNLPKSFFALREVVVVALVCNVVPVVPTPTSNFVQKITKSNPMPVVLVGSSHAGSLLRRTVVTLLLGILLASTPTSSTNSSNVTTAPAVISNAPAARKTRRPRAPAAPTRRTGHAHNVNSKRFRFNSLKLPGKKGAAFILSAGAIVNSNSLGAYWNYEWGLPRPVNQPSNIEFVPMQWGGTSNATLQARLNQYVVPYINSGQVKRLFGFNEPDSTAQSNLSPDAAAALWPTLEALGIPLCSPSCVAGLPIGNDNWLDVFMNKTNALNLRVDYVGVHWYAGPSVQGFQHYLSTVYARYNRPILVTEFAVADWSANATKPNQFSQAQILTFMKTVLPWMESQSFVLGYVWFPFPATSLQGGTSALFDQSGNLTYLGLYYQSVNTTNPQGDQTIEVPTPSPTLRPTPLPTTLSPSVRPTLRPTSAPTLPPTSAPSSAPFTTTLAPTSAPTLPSTSAPSPAPFTSAPSSFPPHTMTPSAPPS